MFENYPVYHTIIYGDTLYTLARDYSTTVHDILNANPNIDPYNLRIGSVITIIPAHNMETDVHHSNCISMNEFDLNKQMRLFWSQHVYWTRLLIISIASRPS